MSAYTTIDTGHRRSLAALLGFSPAVRGAGLADHDHDGRSSRSRFPACAATW